MYFRKYLSTLIWIGVILVIINMPSCSNEPEGLKIVLDRYSNYKDFTVLLSDMDYRNGGYWHRYEVVLPGKEATFTNKETEWLAVSSAFFKKHQDNMGMEVASKTDGVVTEKVAPPGYSQYVGNSRYGEWEERNNGNSFWAFYGRYAFLNTIFNMGSRPARYGDWNNYSSNYRNRNEPYYGSGGGGSGGRYYGTSSYTTSERGQNKTWTNRSPSFKNSIRSKVQRSSSNTIRRTSRSSNRYSGSSSRGRGGGGGK